VTRVEVFTPVAGYSGEVAGVWFENGRGEAERGSAALRYFRQQGYGIGEPVDPPAAPEPVDPRTLGTHGDGIAHVGPRLRDAAVDPQPGDFLVPTNAGAANPHGPLVASPGIHAAPPAPIVPGPVSKDPAQQDRQETAVAERVLVEGQDVRAATTSSATAAASGSQRPPQSAVKADWVAYATNHPDEDRRLPQEDAETLTKPQLIELYVD
jgi:hypothetical protein